MSFGKSGIHDWLVQRFTALYLAVYILVCFGIAIVQPEINFTNWHIFFMHPVVKIATFIALGSLALHAWIGLWTVLTDYVHIIAVRYFLQVIILIALFSYFIWGIQILY